MVEKISGQTAGVIKRQQLQTSALKAEFAREVGGVEFNRRLMAFVVRVSTLIESAHAVGAAETELERHARRTTPSIREDGLARVLRGETTLEEVLRVTRED